MNKKDYLIFSGFIFGMVSILHFLRVFKEWTLTVGAYSIPLWVSWLAFVITGLMAWQAYRLNK